MRFAFDDDHLAFRNAFRDLLAKECPPSVVRAAWPDDMAGGEPAGAAGGKALDGLWAAIADMGVLGIAVPEGHGGLGMAELDWVLLAEEAGYAALPAPFVETVVVAAPALAAAGDPGGRLGRLVAGELTVAAQFADSVVVPYGRSADAFLFRRLDQLWLVDADVVSVAPLDAVDRSRRPGVVEWDEADATPLGDEGAVRVAFDRGALGTAAQLVGLGRRMLDMTVAHVVDRRQFGVPIGTFQAVKHHLADVATGLAFAAPAVHRGAHSLAAGDPAASRDVSMAKAMASDAAALAGRHALQCHGAIGYTVEYDLHLYLKRTWALTRGWGDAAWHRRRIGEALGVSW